MPPHLFPDDPAVSIRGSVNLGVRGNKLRGSVNHPQSNVRFCVHFSGEPQALASQRCFRNQKGLKSSFCWGVLERTMVPKMGEWKLFSSTFCPCSMEVLPPPPRLSATYTCGCLWEGHLTSLDGLFSCNEQWVEFFSVGTSLALTLVAGEDI